MTSGGAFPKGARKKPFQRRRVSICPITAAAFAENKEAISAERYNAVLFRNCIYVASPRHMDAINLAFAQMTDLQKHRVSTRIAEGKETMLFGTARGDGAFWEWDEEYQNARMKMYGFD